MIKKISITLMTMVILGLTGCGGGGGSSSSDTISPTTMDINQTYTMSVSSVITKTSDDANITLETNIDTNVTTATLTGGSATCTYCTATN